MKKLNEIYYLGQPLKIKRVDRNNEISYFYGRYYGVGFGSQDIISDKNVISIATPYGDIVSCLAECFEEIKGEDLKVLEDLERKYNKPYYPHLIKDNGVFYKFYEHNKQCLTYDFYLDENYEKEGYCYVDKELFGKALSCIISTKFNERFYFNDICYIYIGKVLEDCKNNDVIQKRYLSFVSTKKYPENYIKKFSTKIYEPYMKSHQILQNMIFMKQCLKRSLLK